MKVWLATVAFAESIIFPIPTSAFLMAVYMAGAKRWFYLAAFTTFFSILGGIVGYFLGLFFFDLIGIKIVGFYHLGEELETAKGLYDENAFSVTLIGAFTPIPYKIFVLAAGFLKVNFFQFLFASILGRGLQFFVVALVMKKYGEHATRLFLKYFNTFLIIGALLFLYILLF